VVLIKPAQQQTDVFGQLFLHNVACRLTQGLANFVEEDRVGSCGYFGLRRMLIKRL
jgi:hypothetical protein